MNRLAAMQQAPLRIVLYSFLFLFIGAGETPANPGATSLVDPQISLNDLKLKSINASVPYDSAKKLWRFKALMIFENTRSSSFKLQMSYLNWFPFFENPGDGPLSWNNFALNKPSIRVNNRPIHLNIPRVFAEAQNNSRQVVSEADAVSHFQAAIKKGINSIELVVELKGASSQDGLNSCFNIPAKAAKTNSLTAYWTKGKSAAKHWDLVDGGCQSVALLLRPLINWSRTSSNTKLNLKIEIPPNSDPNLVFVSPASSSIKNSWVYWKEEKIDFSQDYRLVINQPRLLIKKTASKQTSRPPFFESNKHLNSWIKNMQANGADQRFYSQMRALILGRYGHKPFDNHLYVYLKRRPWYKEKKKFKKSKLSPLDASFASILQKMAYPSH